MSSRFEILSVFVLLHLVVVPGGALGQRLFVGLETSPSQPTRSTDLSGFPDVTWESHFTFDVSGAAATPSGTLYLCNGAFTTQLYEATLDGSPEFLSITAVDLTALAYGRGTLWGYSNYADPKGIYEIDPATGQVELVLDVWTGTGYRFFALDYNPADDKLYGYTEYGMSGLYRIDIDTGEMTFLVGTIPATNGQGRGMAIGENTVYLTATRGDEDIPCFAYDLAQGPGGEWSPFTNPYPNQHATGGAAWIPDPTADAGAWGTGSGETMRLFPVQPNPMVRSGRIHFEMPRSGLVETAIFDLRGRSIVVLLDGEIAAGSHLLEWDGADGHGRSLPTGIYFIRFRAFGGTRIERFALIR